MWALFNPEKIGGHFDLPFGFSKITFSGQSFKLWFFVIFNINISDLRSLMRLKTNIIFQ